ncbi:hypothetical protein [Paraburkholderia kururiensis]|uniref:hypothetical protein n=1 Tax=Paraburkholderia kururiensis TaxID=984307 RepID=UPI000A522BB4|nr:hypothetical protein [Paraburkholderia kururiensis]
MLTFRFGFDRDILHEMDRLHESAGGFAWRETLQDVSTWDSIRARRVVDRALGLIDVVSAEDTRCDEVALFDPEFQQWHFVPGPAVDVPSTGDL